MPDGLRTLIARYVKHRDMIALHALHHEWSQFRFARLLDQNSGQTFLLVSTSRSQLPAVANLTTYESASEAIVVSDGVDQDRIDHFISSRAGWLEFKPVKKEGAT